MEMELFRHSIYELSKGVRDLVLLTDEVEKTEKMIQRLEKEKIPYECQKVNEKKSNLFFGKQECIDVVRQFETTQLNKLSAEQDFILGAMLGYNLREQCVRYLHKK